MTPQLCPPVRAADRLVLFRLFVVATAREVRARFVA